MDRPSGVSSANDANCATSASRAAEIPGARLEQARATIDAAGARQAIAAAHEHMVRDQPTDHIGDVQVLKEAIEVARKAS